jgi:ABC-type branched-subunit amino acid transport system ATPase component
MTALVETVGLRAGYGDVEIVRDLDLRVEAGEVVALLGPNGAGKTTTLLTIAGELPPLDGEVRFLGAATRDPLHVRARRGLAFVTQERAVLMDLTVAENLRVSRCDIGQAVELFPELKDHLERRVGLLSGGQQQMLALARCLARSSKILLVDELSLGLAPKVVDRLLAAVRAAADDGLGVLLVEQHVHKALRIADRVLVMRRGSVELEGTAADLRDRVDDIQNAYLPPITPEAAPS